MFVAAIGILTGGAFFTANWVRVSNRDKKAIVDALDKALVRTKYHIKNTKTHEGNNEASTELYDLWNDVANKIRPYDEMNAETFKMKSQYWLEPNAWFNEIDNDYLEDELRMSLEAVTKEFYKLKTLWDIKT